MRHLIPLKFDGGDSESEELIMELISLGKYDAAYIRSDYAELGLRAFDNLKLLLLAKSKLIFPGQLDQRISYY